MLEILRTANVPWVRQREATAMMEFAESFSTLNDCRHVVPVLLLSLVTRHLSLLLIHRFALLSFLSFAKSDRSDAPFPSK
jgi:hypothetical protein